jgi:hypothetical protein
MVLLEQEEVWVIGLVELMDMPDKVEMEDKEEEPVLEAVEGAEMVEEVEAKEVKAVGAEEMDPMEVTVVEAEVAVGEQAAVVVWVAVEAEDQVAFSLTMLEEETVVQVPFPVVVLLEPGPAREEDENHDLKSLMIINLITENKEF